MESYRLLNGLTFYDGPALLGRVCESSFTFPFLLFFFFFFSAADRNGASPTFSIRRGRMADCRKVDPSIAPNERVRDYLVNRSIKVVGATGSINPRTVRVNGAAARIKRKKKTAKRGRRVKRILSSSLSLSSVKQQDVDLDTDKRATLSSFFPLYLPLAYPLFSRGLHA